MSQLRAWKQLLGLIRPRAIAARSFICMQHSAPVALDLVESGLVKVVYSRQDGKTAVLGYRFPGQFVQPWAYSLNLETYPFSAIAVTTCCAHHISAETMNKFALTEKGAALWRLQYGTDLFADELRLIEAKHLDARQRFRKLLWQIGTVVANGSLGSVRLPSGVTASDMASVIGISPSELSRIKRQLIYEGCITGPGRTLTILNLKRLLDREMLLP